MPARRKPDARATWTTPAPLLREWSALAGGLGTPRRLSAGEVLFRRDEPSDGFFLIEDGLAKASAIAASGVERLVEIMGAGCLFGEGTALEGAPRLVTVEALSPLRLRHYRTAAVTAAMAADPRIGLCLIRLLAAKQRSLAHRLIEVAALPPRERLADLVARLRRDGAEPGRLPLTHEEIASYLGLSRITVTRGLVALRRTG
jgi:CRP-like cAMP-binding protein